MVSTLFLALCRAYSTIHLFKFTTGWTLSRQFLFYCSVLRPISTRKSSTPLSSWNLYSIWSSNSFHRQVWPHTDDLSRLIWKMFLRIQMFSTTLKNTFVYWFFICKFSLFFFIIWVYTQPKNVNDDQYSDATKKNWLILPIKVSRQSCVLSWARL